MSRILVLAYYYPPLGGAGVQRTVAFVRHLPRFGYESTVVTGPDVSVTGWAPPDKGLEELIPAGTEVARVNGPEPGRAGGWHSRVVRWLRATDPFDRWWAAGAYEQGRGAVGGVDAIYASMSPWVSAEAAARLSAESGKPWIADLRDPWALDEVLLYPTALHRRVEQRRMRRLLATAAAIVMNTPEATDVLRWEFPELEATPVVTIPNGFEPEDFQGPRPRRDDGRFRIVHAGYVHTEGGPGWTSRLLGGSYRGYDLHTRSHTYLMGAVDRLLDDDPSLASELEVHLVGLLSERDRAALRADVVRAHGYLAHAETIELLRSADLLFLPMHDLPAGRRARIVPGKTYEYLAARRPILAAVPDGDARDLLVRAGTATVCRPAAVGCMATAIRARLDAVRTGEPEPEIDEALLREYKRAVPTKRLAEVIDQVVGTDRGGSGTRRASAVA